MRMRHRHKEDTGLRVLPARIRRVVASNKLFVAVLVPAFLLRVDAELGYRWWAYFNDSFDYISTAATGVTDPTRVSGYSIFLRVLMPLHSLGLVTVLQHAMGLAVGVMIYALARHRFGAPTWLAVVVALPVLYDGFEIQLEHLILSDTLFLFIAVLAITLLLWTPQVTLWKCAVAGLLLGLSAVVRSTGLPLIPVFALYLIIALVPATRRNWRNWRPLVAGLAVFGALAAAPNLAYMALYDQQHGQFAENTANGVFLYSRVMTFAECSKMGISSDPQLLALCTTVPPDQRPIAQAYIWTPASPLDRFPPTKFSPLPNSLAQQFAIKAIEAQPLAYARTAFDDTWRVFSWPRTVFPNAATYDEYLFGYHPLAIPPSAIFGFQNTAAYYEQGNPNTRIVGPWAGIIRVYQRYVWLPGTVYGLILLGGLIALCWRWRRGGRDALLPWLSSLALIVVPAATAEFDYRYVTTAVPFGCLALALAFGTLRRSGPHPAVPAPAGTGTLDGDVEAESHVEADAVSSVTGDSDGAAASALGEPGGAAGFARGVTGGRLGGRKANAGHHQRYLTSYAARGLLVRPFRVGPVR
jgi:hypothetical protein